LGWFWLLDAALQLEPANFARDYPLGDLAQSVMGAPPWENRLVFAGIRPFVAHWPWWNLAAALLQASIGLGLVLERRVRAVLIFSFAWAACIWLLGESLGMLPTGFAMMLTGAPGPAVLLAVIGALAWPPRSAGMPSAERDLVDQRSWAATWSVLWCGSALLQLPVVYPVAVMIRANFTDAALGQRAALVDISSALSHLALLQAAWFSAVLAAIQLSVGLGGLLGPSSRRLCLVAGIVVSVAFWVAGQLLGGILSPGATDPGTAPLVVLLALAGWPRRPRHPVGAGGASGDHRGFELTSVPVQHPA
jgi:hypothetical protein